MDDTVYFVGYARLPEIVPARGQSERLAIGLEVDVKSGLVVDVSSTVPTLLGQKIVLTSIIDRNLNTDYNEIVEIIKRRFQGECQRAITVAFKNAVEKYKAFCSDNQ